MYISVYSLHAWLLWLHGAIRMECHFRDDHIKSTSVAQCMAWQLLIVQ